MSSSLDKDHQPTATQLRAARRQRRMIDLLLGPGSSSQIAADRANHPGLQDLVDAGLAIAHVDTDERMTRIRLTGTGLAAALLILEDRR